MNRSQPKNEIKQTREETQKKHTNKTKQTDGKRTPVQTNKYLIVIMQIRAQLIQWIYALALNYMHRTTNTTDGRQRKKIWILFIWYEYAYIYIEKCITEQERW